MVPIYFPPNMFNDFVDDIFKKPELFPSTRRVINHLFKSYNCSVRENFNKFIKGSPDGFKNIFTIKPSIVYRSISEINDNIDLIKLIYNQQNGNCAFCESSNLMEDVSFFQGEDLHNVLWSNPRYGISLGYRKPYIEAWYLQLYQKLLICNSCYRSRTINLPKSSFINILSPRYMSIFLVYYISSDGYIQTIPELINRGHGTEEHMIHIYNLNRDSLVSNRKKVFQETIEKLSNSDLNIIKSTVADILNGRGNFLLSKICALSTALQDSNLSLTLRKHEIILPLTLRVLNRKYSNLTKEGTIKQLIKINCYHDNIGCESDSTDDIWQYVVKSISHRLKLKYAKKGRNRRIENRKSNGRINSTLKKSSYPQRTLFIESFRVNKYRGISMKDFIKISDYKPVPNMVLLSDNAAGKTRLLQSLFWGLADPIIINKLMKDSDFPERLKPYEAEIEIHFFDINAPLITEFHRAPSDEKETYKFERYWSDSPTETAEHTHIPVFAVGANRFATLHPENDNYQTTNNSPLERRVQFISDCAKTLFIRGRGLPDYLAFMFDDLPNVENHLNIEGPDFTNQPNLPSTKALISWIFSHLLPDIESTKTDRNDISRLHIEYDREYIEKEPEKSPYNRLSLEDGGTESVYFENFSDGYRIMATLGLCLLHGLRSIDGKNDMFMSGIVLIDEIDVHLHPQWRLRLLEDLNSIFPNVQFIFATHDPIVLRSMDARNVIRIESDDGKKESNESCRKDSNKENTNGKYIKATRLHEPNDEGPTNLSGYKIDDLLISEIFNLKSTRSLEEHRSFGQYLRLLHEKNRLKDQSEELNDIKKYQLDNLRKRYGGGHAGFSHPRDVLLMPAIDSLLAEWHYGQDQSNPKKKELIERVKDLFIEMWELG